MCKESEVIEYVEKKFIEHNLNDWSVVINNKLTQWLGRCEPRNKRILINKDFISRNTLAEVKLTVLHEISHALCPYDQHSTKWKRTLKNIGGRPERLNSTANINRNIYKWFAVCPVCGKRHYSVGKPRKASSCSACSNKFDITRLLVYKKTINETF